MKNLMSYLAITRCILFSAMVLCIGNDSWAADVKFLSFIPYSTGESKFKAYVKVEFMRIKYGETDYLLATREDGARFYVLYNTMVNPTCLNRQIAIPNNRYPLIFNLTSRDTIPYIGMDKKPHTIYEYNATFLEDKTCACEENKLNQSVQDVRIQQGLQRRRTSNENFYNIRTKYNQGTQGATSGGGQTSTPSGDTYTPPSSPGGYTPTTSGGGYTPPGSDARRSSRSK
ncbi:MAG: hypothetical protein HYT97_06985 [Elusimicrobia bacterium]|nr:hypothetical protein [Elusimicrobiota bacterium]